MSRKDKSRWSALLTGDGCPMCQDIHLPDNPFSYLVAELPHSYVRLPKRQDVVGWTLVALKRHANELHELAPEELAGFWSEVARVAKAIAEVCEPVKLYHSVYGGRTPHLHCHMLPQYYEDDPRASCSHGHGRE